MPYRSISDLPDTVQEALPPEASELFLRVINRALKDSGDDQKAFRVAWSALRNAGWRPGDDGSWVRKGWQVSAQLEKTERRDDGLLCFGWASVAVNDAGDLVIDHQGDIIEPSELESAVYKYNETHRASTDHHSRSLDAELVESVYIDTEKRVAMGLEPEGRTGWWCGFRVHDGTTAKGVEDGSIRQFSIGGSFERGEMIDGARKLHGLSVDEIAFCQQGAGLGVDLALHKNRQEIEKMTLEEVLEGLGDEARAVIEAALAEAAKDRAAEELEAAAEEPAEETEPTDEELMKSLPAGFAKRLEAERQERQAMVKQLAEIKETQTVDRFARLAKSMSNLPMVTGDLARTLRACDQQLDDVTHAALTGMLDRVQKALGQTFEAAGTQTVSADDRAIDRLNAAARDIATRDGLGIAKAFEAACRQHPDLYREHREDQN